MRKLIKEAGFQHKMLAYTFGISCSMFSQMLSGNTPMPLDVRKGIIAMCEEKKDAN